MIRFSARTAFVSFLSITLFACAPVAWAADTIGPTPDISPAAGILLDRDGGYAIWTKNPDARRAPASLTKVMTALVVITATDPDEHLSISKRAASLDDKVPGAVDLDLREGEVRTVRELLYGLLLHSANDAAIALAEEVGGSVERFAEIMNQTALEIGAANSRFVNPHGLDDEDHYSTARDLGRIALSALELDLFSQIVATQSFALPGFDDRPQLQIQNRNQLLATYAGADGVKTGTTTNAGPSLIVSAQRLGEGRLAVVLGSQGDVFSDARALLNYGYEGFTRRDILGRSEPGGYVTFGDGVTGSIVTKEVVPILEPLAGPPTKIEFRESSLIATTSGEDELVFDEGTLWCFLVSSGKEVCGKPGTKLAGSSKSNPASWLMNSVSGIMRALSAR